MRDVIAEWLDKFEEHAEQTAHIDDNEGDVLRLVRLTRALYLEHEAAGNTDLSDTPAGSPLGPFDTAWDAAEDTVIALLKELDA